MSDQGLFEEQPKVLFIEELDETVVIQTITNSQSLLDAIKKAQEYLQ